MLEYKIQMNISLIFFLNRKVIAQYTIIYSRARGDVLVNCRQTDMIHCEFLIIRRSNNNEFRKYFTVLWLKRSVK